MLLTTELHVTELNCQHYAVVMLTTATSAIVTLCDFNQRIRRDSWPLLLAAFASGLFTASAASLAAAGVSRVVRIHLVRAVVGDRLVCTAVRVGLVGLVVHPCLVRRTVRVHLIGVVVAIRLVRHAVGWLLQIAVNT